MFYSLVDLFIYNFIKYENMMDYAKTLVDILELYQRNNFFFIWDYLLTFFFDEI